MDIQTTRCYLRPLQTSDAVPLSAILSDKNTMRYYPHPFSFAEVEQWIARNLVRYTVFGFGLWAVVDRATDQLIGDCGITMQSINGIILPEVGYHIHPHFQNKGIATEVARKCCATIFSSTPFRYLYAYMKHDNIPSQRVAQKLGMHLYDHYSDDTNSKTVVYRMSKTEFMSLPVD